MSESSSVGLVARVQLVAVAHAANLLKGRTRQARHGEAGHGVAGHGEAGQAGQAGWAGQGRAGGGF